MIMLKTASEYLFARFTLQAPTNYLLYAVGREILFLRFFISLCKTEIKNCLLGDITKYKDYPAAFALSLHRGHHNIIKINRDI